MLRCRPVSLVNFCLLSPRDRDVSGTEKISFYLNGGFIRTSKSMESSGMIVLWNFLAHFSQSW